LTVRVLLPREQAVATKSDKPGLHATPATVVACLGLLVGGCQPIHSGDTAALLRGGTVWSHPLARNVGQGASHLNPKDAPFDAKGDGVTDDSAALQAWLTAGGSRLADGTYRITTGLTLAGQARQLYTENAKILADGYDITALTVTGNKASIRVHVDGNYKAAYGVKVTGAAAVVENGRYENFYSTTQSRRGIDATTSGGIIVRNNTIRNVVSVGDATIGNGNGSSRGVGLNADVPATARSIISGNYIENIAGEEGDAVHVLFYDGTASPFASGDVAISDNKILNVSRRFIKVQASNVVVERNELNFNLTAVPEHPSSAISIIQSENVNVTGNRINPNLIGSCISVAGAIGEPLRGIQLRDNVLRQEETKAAVSIYLSWTTSAIVQDNTVFGGGVAVSLDSSANAGVKGNTHYRGVAASR
jgi:hypothetical protein